MKLATIVVIASLALTADVNAQEIAGSYSFTVCKVRCTGDPAEVIATGRFALFPDSITLNLALAEAGVTPSPLARYYPYDGHLRACFVVTSRDRALEDRELYVGVHPFSKTTWNVNESEFSLKLYQSPDAGAQFIGQVHGDTIVGINRQMQCCGYGYIVEVGHIRAIKIGPPKAETCEAGSN